MEKKLYRSETNKQIAGVCAGLAEYFDVDVTLVRIAFLVMMLMGGPGFLLYVVLWFVIPEESQVIYQDALKRKNDDLQI